VDKVIQNYRKKRAILPPKFESSMDHVK